MESSPFFSAIKEKQGYPFSSFSYGTSYPLLGSFHSNLPFLSLHPSQVSLTFIFFLCECLAPLQFSDKVQQIVLCPTRQEQAWTTSPSSKLMVVLFFLASNFGVHLESLFCALYAFWFPLLPTPAQHISSSSHHRHLSTSSGLQRGS